MYVCMYVYIYILIDGKRARERDWKRGMGRMGDGYGHTSKHRRVKRSLVKRSLVFANNPVVPPELGVI